MNDRDQELFEAELRKLTPARPPAELMAKLAAAQPVAPREALSAPRQRASGAFPQLSTLNPQRFWRLLLRWLAPAAALGAVVAVLLVWRPLGPATQPRAGLPTVPDKPALKANDVEIDEQLVASFDAVATLPSGLPVRLRCREWTDEVVWRDKASGLEIEQRTPRLEVVPVSFETY